MIRIDTVETCPYTVAGQGVMKIKHDVLGILAGAVHDREEWIALLIGTRSENGLEVVVESVRVPLQERSHGSCELVRQEPCGPEVVGVVHSHHSMGAFFSQTDDTKLNPRFPTSIVVAQLKGDSPIQDNLLGFTYKAEGRAPLPCGAMGIIGFNVLPDPLVESWPVNYTPRYGDPDTRQTLHQCPYTETKIEKFMSLCSTKCGISKTDNAKAIFGRDGRAFIHEVRENTRRGHYQPSQQIDGPYWKADKPIVVDNRRLFKKNRHDFREEGVYGDEAGYLRHWSSSDY